MTSTSPGQAAANAVRPKLVVRDAAAALTCWARALGATEVVRYTAAEQVVFAEIEVLGTRLTVKDADEHDRPTDPGPLLDCLVDDPAALGQGLVDAGGSWVFEVHERPWGGLWGRVRDPFGVQWLLQQPDDATPEQIQALLDG